MCVVSVQLQKHLHWWSFTETDLQCGCGRAGGGLQDDGGSLLPYIQVLLPFSLPSYPSDLQHFRPASTRRSPQHQDTIVDIQDSRISPTHPHRVPVSPPPPRLPCLVCPVASQISLHSCPRRKLYTLVQQEWKELHSAPSPARSKQPLSHNLSPLKSGKAPNWPINVVQ